MSYINQNRYVFTTVKTGISDFKRFSGSSVFYLLRKSDGTFHVKKADGSIDEEVRITKDPRSLDRYSFGSAFSLVEDVSRLHIGSVGVGTDKFGSSEYDKPYYTFLDSGVWKVIGYETEVEGITLEYAILIRVSSGRLFFVFQESDNISVYEIVGNSIVKKTEIPESFLIDAKSYGNEILITLSKGNIMYPGEIVDDPLLGTYEFFVNSPSAFLCESSSDYSAFSSFGESKSIFPAICRKNRNSHNVFVKESKLYAISNVYSSSVGGFYPTVAVGEVDGLWRRPLSMHPFDGVYDTDLIFISVDSDNTVYASCKKGGNYYLTYYSKTENSWKNYDRTMKITFDNSQVS